MEERVNNKELLRYLGLNGAGFNCRGFIGVGL